MIVAVSLLNGIGRDFLPETDEGSILYMPSTLPGLPNREAGWVLQQMDKKAEGFSGSRSRLREDRPGRYVHRSGSADDDRNNCLSQAEIQWREGMTKDKLVAEMDNALQTIGYVNTWVQPIRARVMMQTTGIQTPVGIKVKGRKLPKSKGYRRKLNTASRTAREQSR